MHILDLVDAFITDVRRGQAVEQYQRRMPELFSHVREYWSPRWPQLDEAALLERREIVRRAVDHTIGKVLKLANPDDRVGVVLFVGAEGTRNVSTRMRHRFFEITEQRDGLSGSPPWVERVG